MFRDVGSSTVLGGDRFTLARAGVSTLLPYGFLIAAALATATHLILSALHAPFRLLPLPEPGLVSQGPTPSMLMAASVAGLLATLAGLGVGGLYSLRARREQGDPANSLADAGRPEAVVEPFDASTTSGFLVLLQVKHFAFISSRYGSDAANGVTRRVLDELLRTFPDPHVVRRCAGGEFVVMAATESPDDCILFVEEVRRSVATRTVATGGIELTVALSAAIAQVLPNMPTSLALEAARRAADHARDTACERAVLAFEGHAKAWRC